MSQRHIYTLYIHTFLDFGSTLFFVYPDDSVLTIPLSFSLTLYIYIPLSFSLTNLGTKNVLTHLSGWVGLKDRDAARALFAPKLGKRVSSWEGRERVAKIIINRAPPMPPTLYI